MSNGRHQGAFASNNVRDVLREPWDIDTSIAAGSLMPEEWLPHDRGADTLDLGAKPCAQAWYPPFIITGRLLCIALRLRKELKHCAHASQVRTDLTQSGEHLRCRDCLRLPGIEAGDAPRDLGLPGSIRARFRIRLHANQKPISKGHTLIRRQHKRLV